MTDTPNTPDPDELHEAPPPLPTLVRVSAAFSARMPSQRMLDVISRQEGVDFAALATNQPFRIVAFRALVRDFPEYDQTALWLHAYDVEVEIEDVSPLDGKSPTLALGSAGSGA